MSLIQRRLLNSLYLCLFLSVACLGYAEMGQKLPETPFVYVAILIALGAAYWFEGRFALSIPLSNAVAAVVVLVGAFWLAVSLGRQLPDMDSPFALPRSLVSGAGPIMCCLLLAKLFRPKAVSDLWMLHLLGLVQVILACVLAMGSRMDRDAPLFPLLLLSYLASEAWAQRWFYLNRETTQGQTEPAGAPPRIISFKPAGLFVTSLLLALVIFFSLPQGGLDANIFHGTDSSETGASSNIDLTTEGAVQVSDEQVMRVWARKPSGESVILPETFRLRGSVLSNYAEQRGIWRPFPSSSTTPMLVSRNPSRPGRGLRFEFDIDVSKIQELGRPRMSRNGVEMMSIPVFLADPPAGDYLEHSFRMPGQLTEDTPLNANLFEGMVWLTLKRRTNAIQLTHDYTGSFNDREWEQTLPTPVDYEHYKSVLLKVPSTISTSGRIAAVTREALQWAKLDDKAPIKDKALALERFLSSSGYVYSLERKKLDSSIDPTEDFLCNVKQGHCERFASAIAVMLRTQGIPSRVVVGYRGAEWNEIGNFNVIRQLHAHAWAEALISEENLPGGQKRLRWITLDPSPLGDLAVNPSAITSPLSFARFLWEFFILDFTGSAQRARLMAQLQGTWLGHFLNWWQGLNWWQATLVVGFALAVLIALIWSLSRIVRWLKAKRREGPAQARMTVPFFDRMLRLLSRRGWSPEVGETAAEFARAVKPHLKGSPITLAVAAVPEAVVSPFYDVRYGGRTLSEQQNTHVHQQLDALQKALT